MEFKSKVRIPKFLNLESEPLTKLKQTKNRDLLKLIFM